MTSYDNALREQHADAAKQEKVDDLIPNKNAVPLIVSQPYSNPSMRFGEGPQWIEECDECCDYSTFSWITNDTLSLMTGTLGALGITALDAEYYRHRIDLDRKPNSFNTSFNDRGSTMSFAPDDDDIYAANGVGIVWMRVPGDTETPLYLGDNQPTQKQIEQLLKEYEIYHSTLEGLVNTHMDRFGGSLHISLQQFSREEAHMVGFSDDDIPQFSICDGNGTTSNSDFVSKLEGVLASKGYLTSKNSLFPTGQSTARYASPETGAHGVQLKIFEELYLDPGTLERSTNFRRISKDLHAVMMTMSGYAKEQIRKSQPEAEVVEKSTLDEARLKREGPKPDNS